jgi:hypothetical protein
MKNTRQHSAGKGDTPRAVDYKKWSENYDRIFGKKKNGKRTGKSKEKS